MFKKSKCLKITGFLSLICFILIAAGYYLGARGGSIHTERSLTKEDNPAGLNSLQARNAALRQRLQSLTPNGVYIVIDTGRNRLYLKRGDQTIREAVISSGSGSILKDPSGKRQWIFDTPRGEHQVKSKAVAPLWTRPDWAFIEEGEAIPKDPRKRIEEGVLGDYALGFGSGYFIHGTLYTRLLGRNVTHGCVRVGDKDLEMVYRAAGIGTKIYIF
jgi:L,D-transpeptidase YbiS